MLALLKHRYILHFYKFAVAFAILYWLFKNGNFDFALLRPVMQPAPFAVIFGLILLSYSATTARWRWLLLSQNISISFFKTFRLTLIGLFFSFALPGGVSGDLVKAYYISQDHEPHKWAAAISVIIDRLIGVTVMMGIALAVMLFDSPHVFSEPALLSIFYSVLALFIFSLAFGYILFSQTAFNSRPMRSALKKFERHEKLVRFFVIGHLFGHSKNVLARSVAASVVGQITCTLIFLYAGHLMGADLRWTTYFYCVPIGLMLTAIPISPGGVGVGQAAFYFLFNIYSGKRSDLGPMLVTIYQMFSFILGALGALFYLQYKSSKRV